MATVSAAQVTDEADIATLQSDMTAAEGDITALQSDMTAAQSDITTLQSDVTALEALTPTAVRAATSNTQSVSATTWTQVTLGSETVDNKSIFASSTVTIATTGYYRVTGQVTFSGAEVPKIAIWVNGAEASLYAPNLTAESINITDIFYLSANDTVKLYTYTATASIIVSSTTQVFLALNSI